MKKLFYGLMLGSFMFMNTPLFSQEEVKDSAAATEMVAPAAEEAAPAVAQTADAPVVQEKTFHQSMKKLFLDGGVGYMTPILICFILGLAFAIERIVYLTMASTNTDKLLKNVESALNSGGVEAAKEVCRNTPGPVASIFYQGLDRHKEGIDMVEKSITAYGGVQSGLMDRGLSWIGLFIALAPMLGFYGTVVGMIGAFDAIAAANNISPAIVASGIGVALITTVGGLVVAMILQVLYNYLLSKIDALIGDMEEASISLVDLLVKNNK